jgi:phenylacetate-coenzyme A ligase PaaK-like adenylate-forming protein
MTTATVAPASFVPFRIRTQHLLSTALPAAVDRLAWDRARLTEWQRDRLRALLATAIDRSPFHRRRLVGVDPSTFEVHDLASVPVMTKADMMGAFDDVVTDRRVTRSGAEQAVAATTTVPRPIAGDYVVLASGGSSGERGLFVFAAPTFAEFASTLMRPAVGRLGIGSPSAPAPRIAFVAAASPIHATGCAPCMLEGGPVEFDPVPVTLGLAVIVERLNALQPRVLYGYPSILARLAREQLDGRLRIAPVAISTTSETLLDPMRDALREAFGVPVLNIYGSSEGLVGATEPDGSVHAFASDSCIVELVDEHDQPVAPGTPSASILVTNLYNTVQPLIRFRIEDRLVRQPDATAHGHLRAVVEGRAPELLRYGDLTVHPLVLTSPLTASPAVVEHQVRQTPTGADIDVVVTSTVDHVALADGIRAALCAAGLTDAVVRVRVVDGLARDPATGKVRVVVPLPAAAIGRHCQRVDER